MLSDAMTIYDAQLIQDWKDDLGNLLIFVSVTSVGYRPSTHSSGPRLVSSPVL